MVEKLYLRSLLRIFLLVLLIFGILQLPITAPRPYEYAAPHMSPVGRLLEEVMPPARAYFEACDCTESKAIPPNCKVFPNGSVCTNYECAITSNTRKKCETLDPFPPGDVCAGCKRAGNVHCERPVTCTGGVCP